MELERLKNRPLFPDEKIYKTAFSGSDGSLWHKAMTFAEYENYESQGLIAQTSTGHYYKDKSDDLMGVTISSVENRSNADVTIHTRYSYPVLHNHNYVEIVYVAEGYCRNFMQGTSIDMKAGDVCILAPNAFHALSCTNDESCIINIMVNRKFFDKNFLGYLHGGRLLVEFLEDILYGRSTGPYILFPAGQDGWLRILAQRMISEAAHTPHAYEHSIRLLASEFLLQLVREHEAKAIVPDHSSSSQNSLIVAILGYLSVNYNRATLAGTAEHFGYSPAYLSRMIHDNTGKTFNSIINKLQMEHAAELLLSGQKNLTEIALDVGCFDSSHFNKKFKKYYGVLPKQYAANIGLHDK